MAMKPVREVYPEIEPLYGVWDYDPLLESLGHAILLKVDDDDYQGDSRLLLRDGTRIGHLQFGWGSCSGCDALQSCRTHAEIDELRDGIAAGIKWFSSAAEALEWFTVHDWDGDYSWHTGKQAEYVEKAKELLAGEH